MTVDELIAKLLKCDSDKVVIISDGKGWTNIGKVEEKESNITIYQDKNILFED